MASGEWQGAWIYERRKPAPICGVSKSAAAFRPGGRGCGALSGDRKLERLASQQLASADSVCSNIEEGYGRESTVEYRRFLIIARGSLRETQGRYHRLRHWLPLDVVEQSIGLAEEINRILSATIPKLAHR